MGHSAGGRVHTLAKFQSLMELNGKRETVSIKTMNWGDFLGNAVVKSLPANAGDIGSSPGPGGSHMP